MVFDVTLTGTLAQAATIDYTVVDGGAGFLGATIFNGTLPSGTLAIAAGGTIGAFTIDVPQDTLGASPNGTLEVQISAADVPVFTPETDTFVQGSAVDVALGVVNTASGPADQLAGSFLTGGSAAYSFTGFDAFGSIAAGGTYGGLGVGLDTSADGLFTATITLVADSVLPGGGAPPVALGDTVLTLTATVVPCFVAGTRIRTPAGQVPVETLELGDLVCVEGGGVRPVVWWARSGSICARTRTRTVCSRSASAAMPSGATARHADLFLSPDHAVHVDGVLIPIRRLIDGARVARLRRRHVHYVQIELDRHDIVHAEGLPAESYLDTGDRHSFTAIGLAADVLRGYVARLWEAEGCADFVLAGPVLERVRARLRRRGPSGRAAGP